MADYDAAAKGRTEANASVSTFVSSIVFTTIVSTVFFLIYAIVRNRVPKVYSPKTYLGPAKIRPPDHNAKSFSIEGIRGWMFGERMPDEHGVVQRCGLDAYMFLEFLKKSFFLFLLFSFLSLPILIPLNVYRQRDLSGLNQLTFANVFAIRRLWAHLILTVFFSVVTLWGCMYAIHKYIRRRQAYLMSDDRTQSLQATTILVCGIPEEDCNLPRLKEIFGVMPGGVKRVWLAYKADELDKDIAKRRTLTNKLEAAECTLLRKKLKHHSADNNNNNNSNGYRRRQSQMSTNSHAVLRNNQGNSAGAAAGGNITSMDETFPTDQRPQHRPAKFPMTLFAACCGAPKVDSIMVYRSELSNMNASILAKQQAAMENMHDNGKENRMNAAFIQFHHQLAAHLATQAVVHHKMLTMSPRLLEVHPKDVLWDNLGMSLQSRNVRKTIAVILAIALIIFWSIPVTFVASIAKLDAIVKFAPFLSGVYNLPSFVVGIIQGILPPIFLSILMAIIPIILYKLAHLSGEVLGANKMQRVMTVYHWFSVVHVLLVTTLANGIFAAVQRIKDNPSSLMEMLATSFPQASTFFLSFILLSMIQVPMMLLQIGPLFMYFVGKLFAKTPRQVFSNEGSFTSVDWGMTIPVYTIAFSIGLLYSTIQPLILPLLMIYFGLNYLAYRHMFLYVYRQPLETGGLIFPRLVDQIYVGLIIFQLTMLGLFILSKDVALSIIGFVLLAGSLMTIVISRSKVFKPLIKYLPIEMLDSQRDVRAITPPADTSGTTTRGTGMAAGVSSRNAGATGLRINTDPATILESDINPVARQESFHEKAPYKDPSSPRIEPPSRELYTPTEESRSPLRRLSLHSPHPDSVHGSGISGTDKRDGHSEAMKSSDIPAIRVENTTAEQEGGDARASPHISNVSADMNNNSTYQHDNHNRQSTASTGSSGRGVTHLGTLGHDYSEDASLRVLGGGHQSVLSTSNPAVERPVPAQWAYVHPAMWAQAQPIWLPKDPRGFAEIETLELGNAGLSTTTEAAVMDAKGKVSVDALQRTVAPGDPIWDI